MATSSGKFYLVQGCKISLRILETISGDIPPPGEAIVKLVSQAVAAVETAKTNKDLWNRLRDLLLSIVPVVLEILHSSATPDDLRRSVDRFHKTLEVILERLKEIQPAVKSKSVRRKIAAVFSGDAHASILKECCEDLDWALKEFDVKSRLGDAVRLCEVLETTRETAARARTILKNQFLQNLPRAKTAEFDYEHPDKPQNCFAGTRTGILEDIKKWVVNTEAGVERIFCLKGIAGVGKSTVARTVAQCARDKSILAAQFFFSRAREAELRNAALVFPTIAYQLARFDPDFGERIIAALEADPDAGSRSFKDQLDKLIVEPLTHVQRDPTRVAVIIFDAFDECEATGATQILQLLVNAIPKLPIHLKVLITSRPETHIEDVLAPSTKHLHITALHDIEDYIVKSDIRLYLEGQLRALGPKHHPPLQSTWITDEEIDLIAEKAGNLFIVAATALRFLTKAFNLRAQLDLLLTIISSTYHDSAEATPYLYLDRLYLGILCDLVTPENEKEVTRIFQSLIGSIVLLRDPLPVDALDRLTGSRKGDATSILQHLQSVIQPPSSSNYSPRIYHQSFSDFLQYRCTDPRFRIDNKQHEVRMARQSLTLIRAGVHKGMLSASDPELLHSEVPDVEGKLTAACPLELQYACRFWPVHSLAAMSSEGGIDLVLAKSLEDFVENDLVPWVEVMGGLGSLRLCLASLEDLNSWAATSPCSPLTQGLLNDAHRMLLAHFSTIKAGAQFIGRSVFPFLPGNCHLLAQYPDYIDPAVTVLSGVDLEWPACVTVLKSHSDTVRSVAFSPDTSRLASASDDNTVHICDSMGGGSLVVLKGHSQRVNCVEFSPNGSQLASGSDDRTIRIWDPLSADFVNILTEHSNPVISLSFSFDSSKLASGSGDATCRIWDASSACCLLTLQGHSDWVRSVTFSREGLRLATGSDDQTIRVWDANTGDLLTSLHGHSDWVQSVVFFPNGSQLASASNDQTIKIWDVAAGACVATFEGHTDKIYSMAISPSGTRLASGSRDRTIRIWDTTNHTCITTLTGHSNAVHSVSFSPDGSRLASGSGDATVRIWDTSITGSPASVQGHSDLVKSITFSPNGLRVASGSNDKMVRLWDAETGGMIATLEGHTHWVESVAFSPDGLQLASGSKDATVRLWDLATKEGIAILEGHSEPVRSVSFCPDNLKLASGSEDKAIRIWNTITKQCLAVLRGHTDVVLAVTFSPDGRRLTSGSGDHDCTVRVWDIAEGSCRMIVDGHSSPAMSAAFSPSGPEVISRSKEGEVRVWNAETGAVVDASAHEARTRTGRQVVFEDGRLSQIDVSGSRRLLCIVPVSYVVDPVWFATRTAFYELGPDRSRVALGCEDGTVLILEVVLYWTSRLHYHYREN